MNQEITFRFSLFQGDLIYALAGIREACRKYKTTAHLYLWLGQTTFVHEGWTHPLGGVMLNEKSLEMLRPLLLSQPWITLVKSWTDEHIMVDLDKGRHLIEERGGEPVNLTGIPYGHIARWYFYTQPDLACDLSEPWLSVDPDETIPADAIIVNRSERYRNVNHIDYSILAKYGSRVIFAGLPHEQQQFNLQFNLQLPILVVKDYLELARAIRGCKLFIGNQSFCFALAEAMKVTRILEVWRNAPNVIPHGKDGYDFYFQSALEYYLKQLA